MSSPMATNSAGAGDRSSEERVFSTAALMATIFLAGVYLLSLAEILLGCHQFRFNAPVLLGATIAVAFALRRGHPHITKSLLVFFGVLAIGTAASIAVIDTTYDGIRYHAAGVVAMQDSWNFFADRMPHSELGRGYAKWLAIYPKALWVLGANFHAATGQYEACKVVNWLGILIAFGFAVRLGARLGLRRAQTHLLAALVALNPISVAQLFAFQQDGLMASLILAMVCLLIEQRLAPSKSSAAALCLLIFLIVNLKTTGVVFVVILVGSALAWSLVCRLRLLDFLWPTLATPVGLFVVGFSPFTQGLIEAGNPFHGVIGPGAEPFEQLGERLMPRNRFLLFASSVFGRTERVPSEINFKMPGSVSLKEVREISDATRFGGFGPLFSLALLLAVGGLVARKPGGAVGKLTPAALVAALLAATLIHPAAWWARYVPHFYLVPLVFVAVTWMDSEARRRNRLLGHAVAALLAINVALFSYGLMRSVALSRQMRSDLNRICERAATGRLTIHERQCSNVKGPLLIRAKVRADAAAPGSRADNVEVIADVAFSVN